MDQFGSVVASFAVAFFFLSVAGAYTPSLLLGLIGSLVLLAATVLARFIPFFAGDCFLLKETTARTCLNLGSNAGGTTTTEGHDAAGTGSMGLKVGSLRVGGGGGCVVFG